MSTIPSGFVPCAFTSVDLPVVQHEIQRRACVGRGRVTAYGRWRMNNHDMRQRVADARVARLGTVTVDGRPHMVPCCFALEGDVLYTAVDDVKPKTTREVRRLDNIRARPDAAMLVDHYDDNWSAVWWVRMDGRACVLDAGSDDEKNGVALLVEKYEQYRHPALLGPVIAIDITRWIAWP